MAEYELKYLKREKIAKIKPLAGGEFLYFVLTPKIEDLKLEDLKERIETDISSEFIGQNKHGQRYNVSFSRFEKTDDGTNIVLKIEFITKYTITEDDKDSIIEKTLEEVIERFNSYLPHLWFFKMMFILFF